MEELNLRNYAHLGDAVWELKVREKTIYETQHTKELHKLTTQYVNAGHQAELLRLIEPHLTESEQDLVRRARNLQVPISRRGIQADYRQATAFEILVGYLYLNDKNRLEEIYSIEGVLWKKLFGYLYVFYL